MSTENFNIDVVVCYYNKNKTAHIRYMTLHAMSFLCKQQPSDLNIVIVDGSPFRDEVLEQALGPLGIQYHHCDRELSFAETYNVGIRRTSCPVVVTLANDILIEAHQIRKIAGDIQNEVGCVMPYISFSDYGTQKERRLPVPRRCFPTRMTLNVNAFSRQALEQIGFIPEEMTGCYNDVLLIIRLRESGYSVVLRNVGHVIHIAQQTLKTHSSVSYDDDEALFAEKYPYYWGNGNVYLHKAAQRWATRLIYHIVECLPDYSKKSFLWNIVWAIEPYICAEKGTMREATGRVLRRLFPLSRK